MPGVKGMKRSVPPSTAFKPGHKVQPTAEQRPSSVKLATRMAVASEYRRQFGAIPAEQVVEWMYEAAEMARSKSGDARALVAIIEVALAYNVGKPREQLSEREGIDMLSVIEQAAREMQERTIDVGITVIEGERGGGVGERGEEKKTISMTDYDYTNNEH